VDHGKWLGCILSLAHIFCISASTSFICAKGTCLGGIFTFFSSLVSILCWTIPIVILPRLESECEDAIPDRFQVILDRCHDQLANDQMEKLKGLLVSKLFVWHINKP
jgi:hypothetical protein